MDAIGQFLAQTYCDASYRSSNNAMLAMWDNDRESEREREKVERKRERI